MDWNQDPTRGPGAFGEEDPDLEGDGANPVNRPASGARRATPEDALADAFSGAGDDFLDLDATLESALGEMPPEESLVGEGEEDPAASWLFTLDEEAGDGEEVFPEGPVTVPLAVTAYTPRPRLPGASPTPPPPTPPVPAEASAYSDEAPSGLYEEPVEESVVVDEPEGVLVGAEGEDYEPATLDGSWSDGHRGAGLGRHLLRAAAALVVGLLGFAGYQLWGSGALTDGGDPVELSPGANRLPTYTPEITTPEGRGGPTTPVREAIGRGERQPDPGDEPVELAGEIGPTPGPEPGPGPRGGEIGGPRVSSGGAGTSVADARPRPTRAVRSRWRDLFGMSTSPLRRRSGGATLAELLGPRGPGLPLGGAQPVHWLARGGVPEGTGPVFPTVRLATVGDLQDVWPRTTIPREELGRSTQLLTPLVGAVRVVFATGEIFEGRLYAVGAGAVTLETSYGRVGLEAHRVADIVHVLSADAPPPPDFALGEYVGPSHVRVRAQGGVFTARLVYRDDSQTTVKTEAGTRVTVDTRDVEILATPIPVVIKGDG